MPIRCYRDKFGSRRVDTRGKHHNIGSFLEEDIQGSDNSCQETLEIVQAVAEGKLSEWEGTGNAHTVTIKPNGVTIECIWDESLGVAELSLDDFRECLKEWLAFIST
jgi:uncharacterized protein YacL (UPF0231 family)